MAKSLRGITALVCLTLCLSSSAHEMKIFSSRHAIPDSSGKATIYIAWGHRLPVDDLTDTAALESYDWRAPDGKLMPLKREGMSLQENVVSFNSEGLHTITATRAPSVYSYVLNDSGERQLKRGSKADQSGASVESGTRYVQSAKAFVVVGTPGQEPPSATGLSIEIVPLEGPAMWKPNRDIKFQVLLDGKPIPIADIDAKYVGFKPDDAWCYSTESDKSGKFEIRPQQSGTWAVRATVKKLTQGAVREQYDFEAFTATMTFEVQP